MVCESEINNYICARFVKLTNRKRRMKKTLLAIALVASTIMSYAQDNNTSEEWSTKSVKRGSEIEFSYGVKIGLNFCTYDSDCDDIQARMGQDGILCRWRYKNWALQPEIHYARMGVRSLVTKVNNYDGAAPVTNGKNYSDRFMLHLLTDNIQMPIMFKYYTPLFSYGLNVQAGPMLSQRFNYHISTSSQKSQLRDAKTDQLLELRNIARGQNQFTVLANFGVGFDSESGIGVDLRCSMGITPVFKDDYWRGCYNSKSHDRVWSIQFTYVF